MTKFLESNSSPAFLSSLVGTSCGRQIDGTGKMKKRRGQSTERQLKGPSSAIRRKDRTLVRNEAGQ